MKQYVQTSFSGGISDYTCPHCGGPLGHHYHSPKDGKDVCCLKCAKSDEGEFLRARARATSHVSIRHASWSDILPKRPWPW